MLITNIFKLILVSLTIVSLLVCEASAMPLTGSGSHLSIAGLVDGDLPSVTQWSITDNGGGSLDAIWAEPAHTEWIGTAAGTGAIPGGGFSGNSSWNFTTLTNGSLPIGTHVRLGDLDGGSGAETTTLTAYDSGGSAITTPWLEEPSAFTSNGTPFTANSTASWNWTGTHYFFDGGAVTGSNPEISIIMLTNTEIFSLDIGKPNAGHNVVLSAPSACTADTALNSSGLLIDVGADDDEWTITVDPAGGLVPRPATVIATNSAWDVIPGTRWIRGNTSTSSTTELEYCFDFQSVASPQVSLEVFVDNSADFRINGNPIGSITGVTGHNFSFPSIPISTSDASFFVAGENCLEVSLHNSGGVNGLDVQGSVTNGAGCTTSLPTPPAPAVPAFSTSGRAALISLLVLFGALATFRVRQMKSA